ncbi:MAG: hypothetical protein ABI760_15135 [Ferruginibacter sp.]
MSINLKIVLPLLLALGIVFPGSAQNNITRVEYYLDADPGYGLAQAAVIIASPNLSTSFNVTTVNISQGIHTVGVRSRDANGKWSLDEIWLLFKPTLSVVPANITRAEWYIDSDPGYNNATAITPLAPGISISNLSFSVMLNTLSNGMHIIGVRSRNANGAWSFDEQWLLFKSSVPATLANITKAEWYMDADPGYGNATPITVLTPGIQIAQLSLQADLNAKSNGMHVIGVRSRDANGAWSLDEQWLLFKSAPPVPLTNLKRVEYYIDNDPGYGKGFPLAFNTSTNINPLLSFINGTGLDSGSHKFMVRSQDMNGAWSFDDSLIFVVNTTQAGPFININSLAFTNACAAGPFIVGYHATGTFNPGNQFIAELSNATGSFSNLTQLGPPLTSVSTGGLINCTMPPNIQQGTGYRMRVRSTNPALTSNASTLSISVDKLFLGNDTAFILLCAERGINLTRIYNPANSSILWSITNPTLAPVAKPDSAPVGIHTLFATNAIGCEDSAKATITQKIADWTGSISSNWHTPGNWSTGNIPDSQTHVRVGVNGTPVNPCIVSTNDAEVLSIHARNGFLVQINNNRKIFIRGECDATKLP